MRAMIQCMHENNYQNFTFPSKEKELQILCDSLGIGNNTKTEITVRNVHNDEKLSTLLSDKTVNLDELNFLMKRLDSLDQKELATFYAATYADEDSGEITVAEADIQEDITDVPSGIVAILASSGICLAKLDELIMLEEVVYGQGEIFNS